MRLMSVCSAALLATLGASIAQAQNAAPVAPTPTPAPAIASEENEQQLLVTPEGKALPTNVMRIRAGYGTGSSKFGYDAGGKKVDLPINVTGTKGFLVAEYGLNDKVSLQLLQPYTMKQKGELDRSRALAMADVKKMTDANKLALKQGICQALGTPTAGIPTCVAGLATTKPTAAQVAALNAGLATKAPGITFNANADIGNTVNTYVDDATVKQVKSAAEFDGAKGLGDTEIGFLAALVNKRPLFFSLGTGLRLPVGKCKGLDAGQQPAGRCVAELGLRSNVDWLVVEPLMISWQNQLETAIAKGKVTVGKEDVTAERKGMRNVGFVYIKPSLAPLHHMLAMVAPSVGVSYDYDTKLRADGEEGSQRGHIVNKYAGLLIDGLPFGVPLQFLSEYTAPYSGKNIQAATTSMVYTLKAFAKF